MLCKVIQTLCIQDLCLCDIFYTKSSPKQSVKVSYSLNHFVSNKIKWTDVIMKIIFNVLIMIGTI